MSNNESNVTDPSRETVSLWLRDPSEWVLYKNCKILRAGMNCDITRGVISVFDIHDGATERKVERSELANRNFGRVYDFLASGDFPKAIRFTEWYLTAKFVNAYDNAKIMYEEEGTIDKVTGEFLGGPYSTAAKEFADIGAIDIDATFIPDRIRKARKLYRNGKYDYEKGEEPEDFDFDDDSTLDEEEDDE